ncbi:MAG: ribosome silencing factor [Cyanobacteria bacterium P01_F01_bin.86]
MLDNTSNTIQASATTAAQPKATDSAQTIRDEKSFEIALTAARAADDRKGGDIVCLDVGGVSVIADYFLVITGYSTTQVKAIVTAIEGALLEKLNLQPIRVEGKNEGTWVLLDYGDAIIHVQLEAEREFYNLEAFWGHAQDVAIPL